jgi:hypothetical protein
MKKLCISVFVFASFWAFSQITIPVESSSGVITTVANTTISYKNLKYSNGKIDYIDATTGKEDFLYENSIKKIDYESENQMTVVIDYSNIDYSNVPTPTVPKIEVSKVKDKSEIFSGVIYPEGIYNTKEDFVNKKPSSNPNLIFTELYGFDKKVVNSGDKDICYIKTIDDRKLKNVFAVSKDGFLYFNIKAILKNIEKGKGDGSQDSDNPNAYSLAMMGGENFLYTEVPLGNVWGKALAAGVAGGIGGATGSIVVSTSGIHSDAYKGVVFDLGKQNFDIFKNCEDFNKFLSQSAPDKVINCLPKRDYYSEIRKIIQEIK